MVGILTTKAKDDNLLLSLFLVSAGVSKTLAEGSIPSRLAILGSSNGRTLGFEPGNIGSSPVPRT